jgi:hypothetical protein
VNSPTIVTLTHSLSQVTVQPAAIEFVSQKYCPSSDPVFELVPPTFAELASKFYNNIESPVITRNNVWEVYLEILRQFHELDNISFPVEWQHAASLGRQQEGLQPQDADLAFFSDLQPLAGGMDILADDGSFYMGGVHGGHGLGLNCQPSPS